MSVSNSIMIKYGLGHTPTESEIARWITETEAQIVAGYPAEEAGRRAAKMIWPDAGTYLYKTQSDTILALLAAAKKR